MIKFFGYVFLWLFSYSICCGLATSFAGEGSSDEVKKRRKRVTIALTVLMTLLEAAGIYHDLT